MVFGEETEGGWLNNQILHSVGQIVMLLGEPGESVDGKKRFIPIKLETGERGVLSLAVKRLYQKYRVVPETPVWGTPTLTDLITVLEEMRDPIATLFATRLRYFIYGSLSDTSEKTPDGAAFDGQTTIDWRFENHIVYYDFKTVPEILLPLFYSVKPLDRDALRARLLALADRAGARVLGAYEWGLGEKTKKANAALAGLGSTRRILVSDTMLAEYSDEEIEVVLAHELAHHVHGDIWKSIAFESALVVGGFYCASVTRCYPGRAPGGGGDRTPTAREQELDHVGQVITRRPCERR